MAALTKASSGRAHDALLNHESVKRMRTRDPNGSFDLSAGYTVKASAAAIAFLWSNWEVLYRLAPGPISAIRLTDESWEAKGFGGYGEWHLRKKSVGVDSGYFEFFTLGRIFGTRFRTRSSFAYNRIDDETIAYIGEASTILSTILTPLHWLMRSLGTMATMYVNKVGGKVAGQISSNPDMVKERVGLEPWRLYLEFMEEEAMIRRGGRGECRHFTASELFVRESSRKDELQILREKLEALEAKISTWVATGGLTLGDYHSALEVFASNPRIALVQNRTIVEHIAKVIYELECGKPRETLMLEKLIDPCINQSPNVPANIVAHMRTVQNFGNVGGHAQKIEVRRSIDAAEFSVSFTSTLKITEWFFAEYLPRHGKVIRP